MESKELRRRGNRRRWPLFLTPPAKLISGLKSGYSLSDQSVTNIIYIIRFFYFLYFFLEILKKKDKKFEVCEE